MAFSDRLAEYTRRYKALQRPAYLRGLQSFYYIQIKQGLGYAMKMNKGKLYGGFLTAVALKLARHYFKWGVKVKDLVDQIFEEKKSRFE